MADLSNIDPRITQQERVTRRRDRMFSRQSADAPTRRYQQDMRNASRGNGGAGELMRALGMVKDAASDFQHYQEGRAEKQREEDQSAAFIDAATGMVDEARMAKSKAYREGALLSRTQADWSSGLPDLERGLQELIQNQTDPDPAKREAEVSSYLEQYNRTFAVDEEGGLKDFGSPGANRWLAEQMAGLRSNAMSKASGLIDKRMGEESLANMATVVRGQIVAGQDVDWNKALGLLLPSVDPKAGMDELVKAAKGAVGELEGSDPVRGRRIIDGLLGWAKQSTPGAEATLPKPIISGNLSEAIRFRVKNSDGSVSTVRTMSIGTDKGEVLIPTVVDGKVVSDEVAIAHYRKTGENFGTFSTPEEATSYAMSLHERHAKQLTQESSAPTGLLQPFQGFVAGERTGKMGDARSGGSSHNGEDFPVPVGTPITAPLGGEVISSMRNARGGNQVRVRLDNGAIVGFAHLSSREVQVGQRVEAGAQLGLSGNTGKSTGPHVHMTMEVGGKKVSPSSYFAEQPVGTPATPAAVAQTPLPSEQADVAGGVQLTPPTGALTLSADQVLDLQDFRRTYSNRIDAKVERDRGEAQAATSAEYLTRLAGVGAYPSPVEIRQALQAGRLSPQQGVQLLNIIDSDRRQAMSDARQAASWAREDTRESKEDYLKGRIGSILGPVYAGRSTITEATGKLLEVASREADPEVRQAILREAGGELGSVQSLRLKGPEYQSADTDLSSWEETYASQLSKVRLPRGMDQTKARALIRSKMDTFRTELGRGNWPSDKVGVFMNSAERRLDQWFTTTFPPRPAAPRK